MMSYTSRSSPTSPRAASLSGKSDTSAGGDFNLSVMGSSLSRASRPQQLHSFRLQTNTQTNEHVTHRSLNLLVRLCWKQGFSNIVHFQGI
jgi:hypothetical protein